MTQGRSLLAQVFKNFVASLKPRNFWGELKGKDEFGVEYYESSSTGHKRPARWFAPPKGGDFQQELPVEWEAWLRHKRKLPPTEEEIQLNKLKRMKTIENAMKLEKSETTKKDEIKSFKKPAFPTYEEYSTHPAADAEKKNQKW